MITMRNTRIKKHTFSKGPMNNHSGLTFIELMIAVAIIGILAGISIYVYSGYIRRSHRLDAVNALLSISLAEERYRTNNTSYGTLAQAWGGVATSPDGYYTLTITNVSGTRYTLTATAVGDQANDKANGTACNVLTFDMNNGSITKTPSACWP